MSLLSSFPEVEIFFSNNRFTDTELLSFLTDIEKKYTDKNLRKALHSLIGLKIMQYQSIPDLVIEHKNIIVKSKPFKLKRKESIKYHPLLYHLKNFTIENIAYSLELRPERILNLLSQKGINKSNSDLFTDDEFNQVTEMLSSFLFGLERKGKSLEQIKRVKNTNKEKSIGKGYGVYSEIIARGGTGKLIYIRKV